MIALVIVIVTVLQSVAVDLGPPYQLAFAAYPYLTDCDPNDLNNASAYRGYELTLLRDAMEFGNLTYGVDLVFQCIPFQEGDSVVMGSNGSDNIIGSFGANPIQTIPLDLGYAWSVPTMTAGLSVAYVKDNSPAITKLFYFQSFTWELYLFLLLLPLLLGLIVYIFQMREQNCFNFVHVFYMYFFKLDFLKNLKCESRLLELTFQIAMTVLMTLYTARLTNVLTEQKTFGGVNSVSDIRGARIASDALFEIYVENMGGRFVQTPDIQSVSEYADPYKKMAELIRSTNCTYFIYDTPIIEDFVQQECDFVLAFKDVVKFEYGISFGLNAPEEIKTKLDYGIIKALETKPQHIRSLEAMEMFGTRNTCPTDSDQAKIAFSDMAGLWVIWCCFLVMSIITFLISFLWKRYRRVSRTPFDQELRGKREQMIRNELSANFCGNILISLDILREQKNFLLENTRYCSEKMNLNPEILKQMRLLLSHDEEMLEPRSPRIGSREDSISPFISPKKTRLQSWISSIVPMTPKRISDTSSPSIIILESPKNTPAFRKELNNAAKRFNKDSFVPFSKQKVNQFIREFAVRQSETISEKEVIIRALSNNFDLEPEPMRQRFIVPKVKSNAKWLEVFTPAPSKKRQPKNKLLSQMLYLDYETAFASNQSQNMKSVESSIMAPLGDFEEHNKEKTEILRPRKLESLVSIRRQEKQKSPDKKMKRRILASFGQSAKPMNLRTIDQNQKNLAYSEHFTAQNQALFSLVVPNTSKYLHSSSLSNKISRKLVYYK